ncbi:hypothetical protein [Pleionea sp. CnH1-48]|uniref:hypothetical protein n=1 Tax=Pleionea sp. CnH1-48 TaxID=2954494 RepID=UPI002096DEA4|nr:hypothetical protein [Pleionea sp. CnH1-48]MCO7222767.1 hypothetical protein [Pleionea sp. CnH1-48]
MHTVGTPVLNSSQEIQGVNIEEAQPLVLDEVEPKYHHLDVETELPTFTQKQKYHLLAQSNVHLRKMESLYSRANENLQRAESTSQEISKLKSQIQQNLSTISSLESKSPSVSKETVGTSQQNSNESELKASQLKSENIQLDKKIQELTKLESQLRNEAESLCSLAKTEQLAIKKLEQEVETGSNTPRLTFQGIGQTQLNLAVDTEVTHGNDLQQLVGFPRSGHMTPRSQIPMFSLLHKENATLALNGLSGTELKHFETLLEKAETAGGSSDDINARKMILYKGLASQCASFNSINASLRNEAMERMDALAGMLEGMNNSEICDRFSVINHGGLTREPIVKMENTLKENVVPNSGLGSMQQFEGGCGPTSLLTLLAENDPFLAAQLTDPKTGQETSLKFESDMWEKVKGPGLDGLKIDALKVDESDYKVIKNASQKISESNLKGHQDLMKYLETAHNTDIELSNEALQQIESLKLVDEGVLEPVIDHLLDVLEQKRPVNDGMSIGGDIAIATLLSDHQQEIGLTQFKKEDISGDYSKTEKFYKKCELRQDMKPKLESRISGFSPYKAETLASQAGKGINSIFSTSGHYMCVVGVSDRIYQAPLNGVDTNPNRYNFMIHDPGTGKTAQFSEQELRDSDGIGALFVERFGWEGGQDLASFISTDIQ